MFVRLVWMKDDRKPIRETTYQCHAIYWTESGEADDSTLAMKVPDATPILSLEGDAIGNIDITFEPDENVYVYTMNDNGKTIDSRFIR